MRRSYLWVFSIHKAEGFRKSLVFLAVRVMRGKFMKERSFHLYVYDVSWSQQHWNIFKLKVPHDLPVCRLDGSGSWFQKWMQIYQKLFCWILISWGTNDVTSFGMLRYLYVFSVSRTYISNDACPKLLFEVKEVQLMLSETQVLLLCW